MADNQQKPTNEQPEQPQAQNAIGKVAITPDEIAAVKAKQKEFEDALLAATSEFTLSMYTRLLRALAPSVEKISKAQLIQDRRKTNQKAKQKREALKASKK